MNFTDFNLNEKLLAGLASCSYTECTPVQEQVLKLSQDGSDLYVQSQTGTGKTAAYLVSIIQQMLSNEENRGAKALVMVPTRELAVQVEEEAKALLSAAELKAFSFYGGVGYERQIDAVKKGVDIIIGTPGRLIDLNEGKNLDFSAVKFLVIDEADRMFDMGFYPDLRKLLKVLPASEERQTMLFSATLNSYVKNLAWEYTRDAKEIEIEAENITVTEIRQELIHVSSDDKMRLLIGILKSENASSVIIFCNTKRSCEVVSKRLELNGINSSFIIGDLPQAKRLKILNEFKEGKRAVLVATDVAARGIDVDNLEMVINFDLPNEAENYVHRIGRTARAGKTGKAYTFCSEQDVYSLPPIERFIEMQIPATVADDTLMADDKSKGIYIKTEFQKDYDDSSSKPFRSERGARRQDSFERKRKFERTERPSFRSGSLSEARTGKRRQALNPRGVNSNAENFSQMETLSFEERMKIYKQKYADSQTIENRRTGRAGDRGGAKRPFDAAAKNARKAPYGKSGGKKNSPVRKTGSVQKESARPANKGGKSAQAQKKTGLFSRIKAFFTKK
ncbi:MAG: DEAD/DEAH box helicase [Treponema sp.]